MSLLAPFFLLGLLGIALPVWLHRLQTQTNEKEAFSSSMLLEASEQRVHLQKKLRYLLLLLAFRLLLVTLSRPGIYKADLGELHRFCCIL